MWGRSLVLRLFSFPKECPARESFGDPVPQKHRCSYSKLPFARLRFLLKFRATVLVKESTMATIRFSSEGDIMPHPSFLQIWAGSFSPPHITRTHLRGANRKVFEKFFEFFIFSQSTEKANPHKADWPEWQGFSLCFYMCVITYHIFFLWAALTI